MSQIRSPAAGSANAVKTIPAGKPPDTGQTGWTRFKKDFVIHKYYYLLMLPGLITLLLFRYLPMSGLIIAFKDYKVKEGVMGSAWAGVKWFDMLFSNPQFTQVLLNTIWISLLKLLFGFPAPVILAIMINEVRQTALKKTIQTVVYLPHFISWVVIGSLMISLLSPSVGILSLFGVTKNPLLEPGNFRALVVVTDIWKEAGWGTVVYLAAITGISQDLYEAATVDGAGRLQKIRHITVPCIMGTVAVMLIMRCGSLMMTGFDQLYILQTPAVMDVGDVLDTFVYRYGLAMGRFSMATAAGLFQSVVGLILVCISNFCSHKMDQPGVW